VVPFNGYADRVRVRVMVRVRVRVRENTVTLTLALNTVTPTLTQFDAATVVPFNGYADVDAYYADMSLARGNKVRHPPHPNPHTPCMFFAAYLHVYILAAQHVRHLVFTHRLGQRQASVVLAARVVEVRMVKNS
jgi:hypothetical protein